MRALTLTSALFLLTIMPAMADDIPVDSKLKSVTIYSGASPQGYGAPATLTRTGYIQVPRGKHTLVFNDMPAGLMTDTLKTSAQGTAQAVLGAVSTKIVNNVALVSAREQELDEQKKALEQSKKLVNAEIAALGKKQDFLDSINKQAAVKINEQVSDFNLNTTQWIEAANTIHESNAQILKDTLEKQAQILDIDAQIAKINQDMQMLRTGQKQTREVRLPIEVAKPGYLTVSIDYQLNGISWNPIYDARLETASGELEIMQYGAVRQQTGEDWTDISLTLSTAQPSRGATAPELSTMWVDIMQAYTKRSLGGASFNDMARSSIQMEMAAPMAAEADAEIMEAVPVMATINNNGFNAEFEIPGAVSIPADGTETKVLIAPFQADVKIERHIKPQISNSAFLIANATIKGEKPLLAGPVSLFRDGSYIGKTNIPMLNPGKDYDLSFGIDDRIDVAFKTLKDESSEGGVLIGKTNKIDRETITEIQSLRDEAIEVAIFQTLPVSKNEDITVKILDEATTKDYEQDVNNIKGLTDWRYTLAPKEEKDVKLGWSVAWPKDQNITGLQ